MIWCGSVWDWVPGWGCYVSASITDPTCEGESLSLSLFPSPLYYFRCAKLSGRLMRRIDGIYCCDVPCDGNAGPPIGG